MRSALLLSLLMIGVVFAPVTMALDGDGDGIDDSLDMCPYAAGTANSTNGNGCPDADGDGLADFEEEPMYNWDNSFRESVDYLDPVGNSPVAMEWAENGTYFYAGGEANIVKIFSSLGQDLGLFHQMPGDVEEIERSPDGTMLAVASRDGGARIINSTTGALVVDLMPNSNESILSTTWSSSGDRIFFYNSSESVKWYWTSNWTEERTIGPLPGWSGSMDTTPDDRLFIVSSLSQVHAYWISNGTLAWRLLNHTEYIRDIEVSPDGRFIATAGNDNFVYVHWLSNLTQARNYLLSADVYDVEFSPDGATLFIAQRHETFYAYRTDSWASLGSIPDFGNSRNNRGVDSVAVSPDGLRLAMGWRRGYTSVHIAEEGHIRVHGDFATILMESRWRNWFATTDESVRTWQEERTQTTADICAGESYIGSHPNGPSPQFVTKDANHSDNGLWDCKNTDEQILEVSYGRLAGALMVKSGTSTEQCIQTIGGLSMGQVRWMTSNLNKNSLTVSGEMPALVWDSIVPNDDGDNTPEWRDLHSSCADEEIVLSHRWENRSDLRALEETVLCANCNTPDSLYTSTSFRYRAITGEFRSDLIQGVAGPTGEHSIGYTELGYTLNNNNGVYIVPLVDNYTHGVEDAVSSGQTVVNASNNASIAGDWPLQSDMRMYIGLSSLVERMDFAQFLLSDAAMIQWEDLGFHRLSPWDHYVSWQRLGVDMSHILPDSDEDGVWDGDDLCPGTNSTNIVVDANGCGEYQLDDDLDGFTNDIDDCDDVFGTSTFQRIGCPDQDGDGWDDDLDLFPQDSGEWNDTDSDGFGDNSDDCIDVSGNSTEDLIGCIDSDGDGWSDAGDAFSDDPTEWADTDSDTYGDNIDVFPLEPTQWQDTDGDGYGDEEQGLEGDDCVDVAGTSYQNGIFGCIDTDGDGWADSDDDLPNDPEQHLDADGDGVGDSASMSNYDWCIETSEEELALVDENGCGPSERDTDYDTFNDAIDLCPNTPLMQTGQVNSSGCAPSEIDADNDGYSSDIDEFENNPDQWIDTDGDGYGDNTDGLNGDDCPTQEGTSTEDLTGCQDIDGDGWSDVGDAFPGDITQWSDTDNDGFGDNWGNPDWNESRTIGVFVPNAFQGDRCPEEESQFAYSDTQGCLTALVEQTDDGPKSGTETEEDSGISMVLILSIAGIGVVLVLVGVIFTMAKKKPQLKKRKPVKQIPNMDSAIVNRSEIVDTVAPVDSQPVVEEPVVEQQIVADEPVTFVSTWEELPAGEWLPNDEHGTNWYLDNEGRHWYSDQGGFRIWEQ